MPLFEYACQSCAHEFETLVRGDQTPECPACHATELNRRLSTFSAHAQAAPSTMPAMPRGCGSCGDPRGPGSCSIN